MVQEVLQLKKSVYAFSLVNAETPDQEDKDSWMKQIHHEKWKQKVAKWGHINIKYFVFLKISKSHEWPNLCL